MSVKTREDGTELHLNSAQDIEIIKIKEKDGSTTCWDRKSGDIYNTKKDGSETHYSVKNGYFVIRPKYEDSNLEGFIEVLKTKKPLERSWVKDEKGNETYYYKDGTVFYDKEKNVKRDYRADGTLWQETNYNTDAVTYYEKDGKTVRNIVMGVAEWNTHDMVFDKGKLKHIYEIKDHYQNGDGRGDVKLSEKVIDYHYEADGETLDHWTVKKEDSWLTADEQGHVVSAKKEKSTKTYKKDDIKAITSGDVPGYAFIDANKPEYYDNKGDPVWVKEAKKKANDKIAAKKVAKTTQRKSTANALKAQKEKQAVQGFTAANGFGAPWAEASQKKVVAKTAQKAKTTTKAKTTAKKVTKTNSGRS